MVRTWPELCPRLAPFSGDPPLIFRELRPVDRGVIAIDFDCNRHAIRQVYDQFTCGTQAELARNLEEIGLGDGRNASFGGRQLIGRPPIRHVTLEQLVDELHISRPWLVEDRSRDPHIRLALRCHPPAPPQSQRSAPSAVQIQHPPVHLAIAHALGWFGSLAARGSLALNGSLPLHGSLLNNGPLSIPGSLW